MILTNNLKFDLMGIVVTLFVIFIVWFQWSFEYWKRKKPIGPKPAFPFGTMKDFFLGRKTIGHYFRDVYSEYKAKGSRYVICFFGRQPTYVPIDLDLVKAMLQSDFDSFHSHGYPVDEDLNPLSLNLFFLDGTKWREIRAKLTPAFTSGKMKMMQEALVECSKNLTKLLSCCENEPVDIKEISGRFTTDTIGSCAFGLDINSMEDPDKEFKIYGEKVFEMGIVNMIRFTAPFFISTEILKFFKFKSYAQDVIDFYCNIVKTTIKYREQHNIERKDFMNLLIKMKNSTNEKEKLTINEIIGQCFIFFVAGFETSSTTINFASYQLAVHQDIQENAREEINRVLAKYNNEMTYEAVMEMVYLERVIQETLRMHPPVPILFRRCTKPYKIPGESLEIDKTTFSVVSPFGIHFDPEYYPDPNKFDPERFTEENKRTRPSYTWIPFGEGPRICIGQRFGILQTKIGLITLIKNYRFTLNKKTISPLVYIPTRFMLTSEGGIWLNLERISSGK